MGNWLVIIGVSLEIAGALLIGAPLLLPIILGRWDRIASKGYLFPRGGPAERDVEDNAYMLVGGLVLASGFATQLAGHVVSFGNGYLIAVGLAVIFGALLAGGLLAAGRITRWILRRARDNDPVAAAEREKNAA